MSLLRKKNIHDMIDASQHTSALKKSLSAFDLTLLGIGAAVGSGIFVLTGTGALIAGPALMLSFVIAAFACGLAALAYAEFSSTVPISGSTYSYSYATLGEFPAWLVGWALLLDYGLAVSAVAVSWSGYMTSLLSGFGIHVPVALTAAPGAMPGVATLFNLPAFLVAIVLAGLVSLGVRESSRVNNIMVGIKVAVVLLVIAVGAFHVTPENWHPYMPHGWPSVFGASAMMIFAFVGFDAISSAAEEAKNPTRSMPIGLIASLSICAVLYVSVATVATGMVHYPLFAHVANPISFALQHVGQRWVAGFVDLGAVVGMGTVILVMTFGQTRIVYAMSRDGLLPPVLARVHPRFKTPFHATWILGTICSLVGALVPLELLVELVNFGTLAAFSMVSIAVLVLRRTHPAMKRGFRCPGVPLIPVLSVACCLFLLMQLQAATWIACTIWMAVGLLIYFGYSRSHSRLAS